jgi:hypothetical protein
MSRRRWLILTLLMLTLAEMAACAMLVKAAAAPAARVHGH